MRRTDKPNGYQALDQPVVHGDRVGTMPEAFAEMYQTGYRDGYNTVQETGFAKVLMRATLRPTTAQKKQQRRIVVRGECSPASPAPNAVSTSTATKCIVRVANFPRSELFTSDPASSLVQ